MTAAPSMNRLNRAGCRRAGWMGAWQWMRDGENFASIKLRAERDRLHLTYRVRRAGSEWDDGVATVRIVRIACRFGRTRPYFIYRVRVGESGRTWSRPSAVCASLVASVEPWPYFICPGVGNDIACSRRIVKLHRARSSLCIPMQEILPRLK